MSIFDKFLDAIKLNDDYDDEDDFLDDEDEEEDEYEDEKPRGGFFSRFTGGKSRSARDYDDEDDMDDDDDFDFDDDDDEEELPKKSVKPAAAPAPAAAKPVRSSSRTSYSTDRTARPSAYSDRSEPARKEAPKARPEKKAKPAPAPRKKGAMPMEVNVIRPTSMDDTQDIADTLMDSCTVVLNLEGIDVDLAQRIIDFTCGTCYALGGGLQKISSYIYILTPADVDISGDVTSILSGAFDIPSMKSPY